MSLRPSIKGLSVAVRRLEAAARKGPLNCPYCRALGHRSSWLDPRRPIPPQEVMVTVRCEFCRTEYSVDTTGEPADRREAIRLFYSLTLESLFRDYRSCAIYSWCKFRVAAWKKQDARRKKGRLLESSSRRVTLDAAARRRLGRLSAASNDLTASKLEMLEDKYGRTHFDDIDELIEEARRRARFTPEGEPQPEGVEELEGERSKFFVCAALERIIWGETRAETASAIEQLGREIEELIKGAEPIDQASYAALPVF